MKYLEYIVPKLNKKHARKGNNIFVVFFFQQGKKERDLCLKQLSRARIMFGIPKKMTIVWAKPDVIMHNSLLCLSKKKEYNIKCASCCSSNKCGVEKKKKMLIYILASNKQTVKE